MWIPQCVQSSWNIDDDELEKNWRFQFDEQILKQQYFIRIIQFLLPNPEVNPIK